MFERILFPIDFSEVSVDALENCIPQFEAKEVIIIHVVEYVEDIGVLEKIQMKAKGEVDRLVEKLKNKGVNAKGYVSIGSIASTISTEARCPSIEILDRAYCEMVDLIVIPSKGKHIRRRMQIGSTARNLIRKSSIPVLVLKYDWNEKKNELECRCDCEKLFTKPLIALDLSRCSEYTGVVVRKFEENVKEARIIHIIDYGDIDEIEENINKAKQALKVFADKFKFESEIIVDSGIASKEIIVKAIEFGASVIVLGKTGRGFLKEILLGSTADEVIKEGSIPTLIVPC